MASYPAPSESFIGIIYNPLFFNRINLTDYVTYGYVQANFLSRVGVASSIATLTTFSGAVTILGVLTILGGLNLSGGLTVDTLQVNSTSNFIGQSTFTLAPILPAGYEFLTTSAQTITGVKTFTSIPILPAGYEFLTTGAQTITGVKTFTSIPILPAGYEFLTTGTQTITGVKTFASPIVSSGASITANTLLASSIVNNSITQNQIAPPYTLLNSGSAQTILGDKILNGMNTTNDMILNIFSAVSFYTGTIGFIPACTTSYLNPVPRNFDSMLYVGQSIGTGPNQPYGFCICDYNTGSTGFRMSGTGASGNCNIVMNANTEIAQLLTLQNGLFVNLGDITTPNNAVIGTMFCDIFNNNNQTTGTDITFNPNNFVECVVNAGNNSVLPTTGIGYGGLKIGWNCSNILGETDFINLANYTNTGGFNFYTMNSVNLPYLIATLTFSGLTLNGNLTNNSIVNSSGTLPYFIQNNTMALPTTTSTLSGMGIGWNALSGTGECDLINYGQAGGGGGFNFSTITSTQTNRNLALLSTLGNGGFTINPSCGQLRIQDQLAGAYSLNLFLSGSLSVISSKGINTTLFIQCANASGVSTNVFQTSTTNVQPLVNLSPSSTTTFNAFHPTTSLGNNLSTNTTQYATVGFVNANSGSALLPLNNTWTGTNLFRNTTGGITTSLTSTVTNNYFGCGAGNAQNVVIGGNSLGTVNAGNTQNIAICSSGNNCLQNNIGNNNIAIGNLSGNAQTSANQNIYIGGSCGNAITGSNNICIGGSSGAGITTGSNNIAIGATAWGGVNTFSNCTVIGASAPAPLSSNSIILGSTAETVYVQGGSQLTNTLLIGTTVVSTNLQVNGNIIQPVGTIYSTGVTTTFTTIPPYILFSPVASMGFVLPVPGPATAGQIFVIRKVAAGSTVSFTVPGNLPVWVPLNAAISAGLTALSISTVWQFTILSTINAYVTIA